MKKYLFVLPFICSTTLFAQKYNSDTSLIINNQVFKIQTDIINPHQVTLAIYRNEKVVNVDTIESDGLSYLKFPDFDNDGNKDIMLTYMGNNFTYELYLFDKANNRFQFVEGFNRFPSSQALKTNSKYYYSYHRAGCADLNWVSDLFYIDNFKTIHIAHIYGKGCDANLKEEPQIIEVYTIVDDVEENEKLFEKLPYQKNIPHFKDKWDFIKKYWNKNYSKFIKQMTTKCTFSKR